MPANLYLVRKDPCIEDSSLESLLSQALETITETTPRSGRISREEKKILCRALQGRRFTEFQLQRLVIFVGWTGQPTFLGEWSPANLEEFVRTELEWREVRHWLDPPLKRLAEVEGCFREVGKNQARPALLRAMLVTLLTTPAEASSIRATG